MAAPTLPIRIGMDVYSADQQRFLGTVVAVERRPSGVSAGADPHHPAPSSTPLVHEEGAVTGHAEHAEEKTLGEEIGPFPTIALGNTGPQHQSVEARFATAGKEPDVICLVVRPGKINPLAPTLTIPTSAVRSISMERVVVSL